MSAHSLSPDFWNVSEKLFHRSVKPSNPKSDLKASADIRRVERDCINDMIWSNPEAFSSALDFRGMMYGYSGAY